MSIEASWDSIKESLENEKSFILIMPDRDKGAPHCKYWFSLDIDSKSIEEDLENMQDAARELSEKPIKDLLK